ncbi:hypothetical protein CCR85_04205 [Rhodothalassium salexigens]|uniref:enoyl-CoA hydratase/isomerase family protein n=1 Tax=Rhodothalassium salexigens TaxID=1086 RepID=UPI0019143F06|nr:enoyl-CoA hydratase/isomerase family protein [Rhodothalassium salexigens]MBK5910694.1 hypothetical protein [Rhodothalassium salexigens]MBK5920064.1 hypothetical protein [Rhodothalassium salexigens]
MTDGSRPQSPDATANQTDGVRLERTGALGRIVLDRPKALNALTESMCRAVEAQLAAWAEDERIAAVLITAAGERAFCAGGDVVRVAKSAAARTDDDWWRFFHAEYRMNHAIAQFPKPFIAWLDGITMGGGFGISVHGRYRIATPKTLFAMPETALGLIPDVGSGRVLPRMPGKLGLFLGLTGYRCGPADSLYCGYATHHLPSAALPALIEALAAGAGDPDTILAAHASDPGPAPLADHRPAIDRLFNRTSVVEILAALDADGSDWARDQAAHLRTMSPLALAVTFEHQRRGAGLETLAEVLAMEFRVACNMVAGEHDFREGVRALLIDKDKNPRWRPDRLDAVTPEQVAAVFGPAAPGDLSLD